MRDTSQDGFIENRTFEELAIGETASLSHCVTQRDIDLFATVTGDVNPAHVDPTYAAGDMFHHIIVQGMWGGGLISAVLGTKLPGPGTIYLGQELRFRRPVSIGDTITATVTLREKRPEKGEVTLETVCTNQHGEAVITGIAEVLAPKVKVRRPRVALPYIRIGRHDLMHRMLARAAEGGAVATAVVYPTDASSLQAAVDAARAGLIVPVLVGPKARIAAAAQQAGLDIAGLRLVDAPDAPAAAARAVALVHAGEAAMLMKGDLHTEVFLHPVVASGTGLRTARRISHVYAMDVPDYPRLLLLTDCAVSIAPTLAEKAGIVQNAIDLAHMMGIVEPRVAILAAVETVSGRMPSTVDAAALCKMADRGQISGGVLDGPLAFDNAISEAAAKEKGIVSPVAGRADILVVPDLEAGNMLAKQLSFLAGAEAAGVVLGARVPIILTSRADSAATHLASCALGVLMVRAAIPA
ncbi:bifunctional enoyl-CoA hydratase/phosphate acetyltransferase [Falsiroseomonas selenitidurans]|uniref:Bifunctional enoyl-CoA hydratase/phosphate acetyltransferase n=1 Tax=Falsiroseomonas selenitidurans TaxID=2716335 RepID=A0ABX1E996_9PROT|nr:bifunctional enoyl-CoA hydratase/phosphate acetyltransferase [Falsiroseomonas selenitidurans]NKC33611.1 bifunctional enoyl-CoA hydratase/phosphate acetyltransferase [Falsiroseomonas selenitidurans]